MDKSTIESAVKDDFVSHTLDHALATVLRPPALPEGFRQRLMAHMLQHAADDLALRRQVLEAEHAQLRARLQAEHVSLRRDTLILLLVSAFAAGAITVAVAPWLQQEVSLEPGLMRPLLFTVLSLGLGALACWRRLGNRSLF